MDDVTIALHLIIAMSNVPASRYVPVPGETRYVRYFRLAGIRVRIIILNNYTPERIWWTDCPE